MELLNWICSYPEPWVMGLFSLLGALGYASYAVYRKYKEEHDFKFDWKKIADTVWQSTAAGYVAGIALACGWTGILTAMLCGIGIDKIANKLNVGENQILNFVQLAVKFFSKKE